MKAAKFKAEELTVPAPKEIYNIRVYILSIVASMGAIIFGYDLGFIGTTLELVPFKRDFHLTKATPSQTASFAANVVSLLQAGCILGSLAAAPLGDKLGRKTTLILTGLIFCLGSALQTGAHGSRALIFAGRVIGGIGVGAASMLVPLYIAETAPPTIRGRLVGIYEVGVQAGTTVGFWINFGVSRNMPNNSQQWITPFAVQLIPGGLLVVGMFFLSESPRWLARFKGREAALETLSFLRGIPQDHPFLQEEMFRITDQLDQERRSTEGKGLLVQLKELGHKGNRNRIAIGVLIFVFMQMAGSNAINYYSPTIFRSIGLKGTSTGLFATGIYGLVRFCAVLISMIWVVDRFGRTRMLIAGSAVMAFCMWFIGAYIKIARPAKHPHITAGGYTAVTMIYVYAVGFCFSWAGVPWIYCSEIFPLRIRSLGMALCATTHWAMNFMIARSVPYMITGIGFGTYFLFAASLTLAVPFVYFFVPETKGLSLEDMDELFGVPGAGRHLFPHAADEEKGGVQQVEDRESSKDRV